jgi:hypothetical protein
MTASSFMNLARFAPVHGSAVPSRQEGHQSISVTVPLRAATAARSIIREKPGAHMLRHSTGFKLANDGIDTRALQALPWSSQYPEHNTLYGAGPGSFQRILARLILHVPRARVCVRVGRGKVRPAEIWSLSE